MMWDNWSHDKDGKSVGQLYSVNTDCLFMTKPKNKYPNKKKMLSSVVVKFLRLEQQQLILRNIIGRIITHKITLISWVMDMYTLAVLVVVKHTSYASQLPRLTIRSSCHSQIKPLNMSNQYSLMSNQILLTPLNN